MKKPFFVAVALAMTLCSVAFADEEASGETGWYSGAAAQLVLPQGGSRMHRVGGGAARVGYYFTGSLALEAEAAWLENVVGLSARALQDRSPLPRQARGLPFAQAREQRRIREDVLKGGRDESAWKHVF